MRTRKAVKWILAGWVLSLMLTACAGDQDGKTSSARESGVQATTESAPSGSENEGGQPGGNGGDERPSEEEDPDITVPGNLRRPVTPEQPMWLVHVDTWNYADPQKIIDLIPEDILPYVVFNLSLSISWDHDTDEWLMVRDGYETAKSWLRTCADNRVWAMIQPASGCQCHFPDYGPGTDYEDTLYAEFYRDYPNFIGFNYCEQFWGFSSEDFPITPQQRYEHFAGLLELSNKYGGYLVVSWCGNQWSPGINPLAMQKTVPAYEEACRKYTQNYILCEKYTQTSYLYDMESLVLGAYLSGCCGQYGVRYDVTGWTDENGESQDDYRLSTSLAVNLERYALNGMTVIDGPELIWVSDFREVDQKAGEDGYKERKWESTPEFRNVYIDMFRKVLDGTIRIPTREEVAARTKVILVNDVRMGTDDEKYSTPATLFEGLYQMEGDGNLRNNHSFYKSTGRYPTIPMAYVLKDKLAKSMEYQTLVSDLVPQWPPAERGWASVEAKVKIFQELFPEEYTGDCYAGRYENTWVTYNPYKSERLAEGLLDCRYNTCDRIGLTYSRYTSGLIREYADHIDFYLNNFDEKSAAARENIIKIYGCLTEPAYTCKDRGEGRTVCEAVSEWKDGVFTLTLRHNGPVDVTVNCSGTAKDRLTQYGRTAVSSPEKPAFYTGPRQYEAEFFDSADIEELVRNGCRTGVANYQGQGYLKFGKRETAAVRDTVETGRGGEFTLKLRYACGADTDAVALYVNGEKAGSFSLTATPSYSDWNLAEQIVTLKEGANVIEIKATAALESSLYLDNFVVEGDFGER